MAHTEVSAQTVDSYSADLNQITNVNQLRDVSPTDWAYEALRSLAENIYWSLAQPSYQYIQDLQETFFLRHKYADKLAAYHFLGIAQ